MNNNDMTDPRRLATDALELAEKATPEDGYGADADTKLLADAGEDGEGADIWYSDGDQCAHVYDNIGMGVFDALPYAQLFAASRALVPALARALLVALDRIDELETWVKGTSPWKGEEK